MFSSRLFWRIFTAYAALSLVSAAVFVAILADSERDFIQLQVQDRLHDTAVLLRSLTRSAFRDGPSAQLQAELKRLADENGTRLTLVAEDGTVIGDSAENPAVMENHRDRDELLQARHAGFGVSQRTSPTLGISMMYYALRIGTVDEPVGLVRVAMAMESVNAKVARVQRLIWGTAVGVSLVALIATYVIVRKLIRPLETLTSAAQAIAEGNFSQTVTVSNGDEFGALAEAFNAMSRELSKRIEQLQTKQQELEENSELLATVLGSMIEGVVVVDEAQNVLYANSASQPLLDFTTSDVVGKPIWEVARHPTIQDVVNNTLKGVSQQRVEFQIPRSGAVVAMLTSPLPGAPCPGAVLVLHDVTELRRLESIRRDFVSNVSHELKTPLSSVQAYAETLLSGAIDDPQHNRSFVQRISEQSDRLYALIMDLLRLARIESGRDAFEVTAVPIHETVAASVESYETLAASKSIAMEIDPPDLDLCVAADPEGLQTILDNLVDNAVKYIPAGRSIQIRWRRQGQLVQIEVADTGNGIAAEHLPRLFERFYRVDKARSRELGGTGLGLSIVKHLAQVFGGKVEVTSTIGQGSTFTILLPLAVQRDAAAVGASGAR